MGSIVGGAIQSLTGGIAAKDTYNANAPNIDVQNFDPELANSQNLVTGNIGSEQNLAQALQNQANGTGPNPVQAQYQQNVNQNAQQEAGAIASQKGISPALAARLIANNTANANQNAAGTAAVNQASQEQAATNQEANVYSNIGSQAATNQATLQGAESNQNNAINTGSLGAQGINAGVASTNTQGQNQITGGLISGGAAAGAAALAPAAAAAHGGVVPGKSQVKGNSYANDKIPYLLSPGEIVVDKVDAQKSPKKIEEFIAALKKAGPEKGSTTARNGYSKVLESQRILHERMQQIEAMLKAR